MGLFRRPTGGRKGHQSHASLLRPRRQGNVVAMVITDVPGLVTQIPEILEWARVLDTYYLPTRYPNSHAEGAPFERYGRLQSEEAICYAGKIVECVNIQVKRLIGR